MTGETTDSKRGYSITLSIMEDTALIGLEPDTGQWRWEMFTAPFPACVLGNEEAATTLAASYVMGCIGAAHNIQAAYWITALASSRYTPDDVAERVSELQRLLGEDAERLFEALHQYLDSGVGDRTARLLKRELEDIRESLREAAVEISVIPGGRA